MATDVLPQPTPDLAARRKKLAPDVQDAFTAFSERVFAEGALPVKAKQLIAVAVAHVTQCPYCIRGHTKAALRHGATPEELTEAIWVALRVPAATVSVPAHTTTQARAMPRVCDTHASSFIHYILPKELWICFALSR